MFFSSRAPVFFVFLIVEAMTSRAQAQAPARPGVHPPTDTVVSDPGREHFNRGISLADRGSWSEAIAEFEQARALGPSASVHFNLAIAYRELRRLRDAAEAFERFIAIAPPSTAPDVVRLARTSVQQLRAQLGALVIDVQPQSATLLIDDVESRAQTVQWVDPGLHVVTAMSEGRAAVTRTIRAQAGVRMAVRLFVPLRARGARIVVRAQPEQAMIRIDGSDVSQGHADELVAHGPHRIDVLATGFESFTRSLQVSNNQDVLVNVLLEPQRSVLRHPLFWTGVGIAIAAGITTAVILATRVEAPFVGPLANVEAKSL